MIAKRYLVINIELVTEHLLAFCLYNYVPFNNDTVKHARTILTSVSIVMLRHNKVSFLLLVIARPSQFITQAAATVTETIEKRWKMDILHDLL